VTPLASDGRIAIRRFPESGADALRAAIDESRARRERRECSGLLHRGLSRGSAVRSPVPGGLA